MGDDWKKTSPSASVAGVVVQRLLRISGQIEDGDVMGALSSLRGWEGDLNFTEVSELRAKTDLILNDASSFLKGTSPDTDLALGRLEKALGLWR